jgi:hypothetical protein
MQKKYATIIKIAWNESLRTNIGNKRDNFSPPITAKIKIHYYNLKLVKKLAVGIS